MKKNLAFTSLFTLLLFISPHTVCGNHSENLTLQSEQKSWEVSIDPNNGSIKQYRSYSEGKWDTIPFRIDKMSGPAWEDITLLRVKDKKHTFSKEQENIQYTLNYQAADDHLIVTCSMYNKGTNPFMPKRSRIFMGIDSEMTQFPSWDNQFFPTLLRCEKDFAWGYFMSPKQIIMGFGTEEPVASYALNYIYAEELEWKWGHQIKTASLDLLHQLPLPTRHPQNLYALQPKETKTWHIHIGRIDQLSTAKKQLSKWISAPMIECSRYTIAPTENIKINLINVDDHITVNIISPNGNIIPQKIKRTAKNRYQCTFTADNLMGLYQIKATTQKGKTAEASIYVRKPWSWYLKNARDFVVKNPPLFSNGCETFYGYYTAFLAAKHFPEKEKDTPLEEQFNRTLPLFIDTLTWIPKAGAAPDRIQNFSSLIGMLVDLWEATANKTYLEKASHVGDYLCSEKVQSANGAYLSRGTHYTAVIYPAKSMIELANAEKKLIQDPIWKERYCRHHNSAAKAIKDLLLRLDNIQTEGDMTFEDGMITCSALQLALEGLQSENPQQKNEYKNAAAYMMNKHQCLEQLLIPDSRMRGATLRYWEALDIYFSPNQVMNSPHGWSGWKIYATYYLYLLTGEVRYLTDFMDTLGACAQIMDLNGKLRWGFIPDPYVKSKVCIEQPHNKAHWQAVDSIVGEQYLDMISPWLRPDDEKSICAFGERGGAGDNTVQEIFKVMEECSLTTAYVVVDAKGEVSAWNCTAAYKKGVLHISPYETITSTIHLNTAKPITIECNIPKGGIKQHFSKGMHWIGEKPSLIP